MYKTLMQNWLSLVIGCFAIFYFELSFAGGPFTNGASSRAQSMQNAFVGIADDASAVYYNPAGLAQLQRGEVMLSVFSVSPSIDYSVPGQINVATSTKIGYGLSTFLAKPISNGWVFGLGMYAPAARVTDFPASTSLGGTLQKANLLRIDIAGMVAKSWGPISLGLGPVLSRGTYESSVLGFSEKGSGVGSSFQLGALAKLSDEFQLGLTYRSATTISLKGDGGIQGLITGSFEADQHYPAIAVVGVAFRPLGSNLTVAADFEFQNWNRIRSFDRNYWARLFDYATHLVSKTRAQSLKIT